MDIIVVLFAYVLLIYLPVDWVLGSEIGSIRRERKHWLRTAIVNTVQFRVVQCGDLWTVQAKALWLTPWRIVRLPGSKFGAHRTQEQAEDAIDMVKADIRLWLKGK